MGLFRYVALGDSSGVGIGASRGGGYPERIFQRLRAAGHPAGIVNLAESGATSRDVLQWQVGQAASKQPHLVTLGMGTNDLWRMIPTEAFRTNLERIAGALEQTGAEVVVANVPDLTLAPAAEIVERSFGVSRRAFDDRIARFNAAFEALRRRPRFTVVDLFGFGRAELAGHPEYFCADGFHPSAEGYERWADLVWPHALAAAERWSGRSGAARAG